MKNNKVYFISIEGAGTSALALLYKNLGYDVSGSDDGDHFYSDALKKNDIKVLDSYDRRNLPSDIDKVIYSTCITDENPELKEARERGVETLSYPEALAELFNKKMGIAVCGTHGKTTTTAMLGFVFDKLGLSPSVIVGSKVIDWKKNSLTGNGDYFIVEADEYQNKLRYYNPWSAILTSVDYDHPDFFKTPEEYEKSFLEFVEKIPKFGNLVYCNDSRSVVNVSKSANCQKISYGFTPDSDYVVELKKNALSQIFEIKNEGVSLGDFEIMFPGQHNALNATAVIALCHKLKLDLGEVKRALASFRGTARRFERVGSRNGALLIDDYAHHPEEIKATLRTAKDIFPDKNIIAIFHPHTFTRTIALLDDFVQSFGDANRLIVLDIYGSAREKSGKFNSRDIVDLINKYGPQKAEYVPKIEGVIEMLKDSIGKNDVVISMGAGDVWHVTHELSE